MKTFIYSFALIIALALSGCGPIDMHVDRSLKTHFETSDSMESPSYEEGIAWWYRVDSLYRRVSVLEYGETDAGRPLHLVVLGNGPVDKYDLSHRSKPLLLINNAIHPGEPDGVDASMLLVRDILENDSLRYLFKNTLVVIIPYYNVGGALNRNSHSRTNQEGPTEYGFRGNAQNLDLNRDFVKMDSKNAQTFAQLIDEIDPDFYVETHVTNGADYPYTMTYLSTLPCKNDSAFEKLMVEGCTPYLEDYFEQHFGFKMVPYVNVHGYSPENGYSAFYDSPRYSTGYLSTLGIPGYITETHMLKPFKDRVLATYHFLMGSVKMMDERGKEIRETKVSDIRGAIKGAEEFGFNYEVDSSSHELLDFRGYKALFKPSELYEGDRLYYDKDSTFSNSIPYYSRYKPKLKIRKPAAYILKRGYHAVEERLRLNGVEMVELERDTTITVTQYHIVATESSTRPYEKHFYHYDTKVLKDTVDMDFRKGDLMIAMGTAKDKFVMSVLEPETEDSYFNWNFYDAILQQKEWYSDYVFEDKASEYLAKDSVLRHEFDSMVNKNPEMKANKSYVLYWIYQHSPHYEPEHLRYPVFRSER